MFKSKTVFVVGAGASAEVDIPIGKGLTQSISRLLDLEARGRELSKGDRIIYQTLRKVVDAGGDKWRNNTFIESARHISQAMVISPSIDTFLETYATDEERNLLGKLGIARAILIAEAGSKFAPIEDRTKPFAMRNVADTWFLSLAQLLFTGLPAGNVSDVFRNTSFVVFNYDRCLEVFLVRALVIYFRLSDEQAQEIVRKANIFHPYGALGSVFDHDLGRVSFGSESANLLEVSKELYLFTESLQENETLAKARAAIREAQTIVFLGFAFHDQNMALLSPPAPKSEKVSSVRRVLATAHEVSDPDIEIIRAQIGYTLRGRPRRDPDDYTIDIFKGKCAPFFAEYWRSFTA